MPKASFLTHLECSQCGTIFNARIPQGMCPRCSRPLLACYDLDRAKSELPPTCLEGRRSDLWRYRELLPSEGEPVTLGEGWTPLISAARLGRELDHGQLWIKDESGNPTGSFKARGLSVAVTMAKERGFSRLALPTAGNAGLAMAAYAAAAGMEATVYCPVDTPPAFVRGARLLGAEVRLVDGLITDCARLLREETESEGWMDLSTLKEPYRVEGKKTLGYELWEQLSHRLPEVIVYPTGGGTGLVGMWKAFSEMEAMGWIGPERPRMVAVQAEGCAPIVRAFEEGTETARPWEDAFTLASGLRVSAAVGDRLILAALDASRGAAVSVSDGEMIEGMKLLGRLEGILAAPEGGAVVAAASGLIRAGFIREGEMVVLFNTGTALSYLETVMA